LNKNCRSLKMAENHPKYPNFVFVYGTLKRNEPNHHYMTSPSKGSNCFIGVGQVVVALPLVVASRHNVPYLLDRPGHGKLVQGEIYNVDNDMLTLLDEIEDAPRYYKRKLESIKIIEEPAEKYNLEQVIQCWCYKMDTFKQDLLEREHLVSYSSKIYPYTESLDRTRSMDYYKDIME
jgi:gamma-glutamylaminecyclotransferase